MNLRLLKIFLIVCETGSMTRAAKALFMAQPTVSQAVAELEKYYGVRLFERLNHRLYLTAAGERLRSYAQHILNLSEQARKDLADLNQGGTLRVGASLTIGAYLLPGLIRAFQAQLPAVEVFTRVDNTRLIEAHILEDKLDLGLVEGPVASNQLAEEVYCDDHLVFIASPHHTLARQNDGGTEPLRLADLVDQGFIIREPGSGTQAIFEHGMQEAGVRWRTVGIHNNIDAIKRSVIANLGLAVVPQIAIAEEVRQGSLVPLAVEGLTFSRKFNLVYHHQKYFTRAMRAFCEISRALMSGSQPGADQL